MGNRRQVTRLAHELVDLLILVVCFLNICDSGDLMIKIDEIRIVDRVALLGCFVAAVCHGAPPLGFDSRSDRRFGVFGLFTPVIIGFVNPTGFGRSFGSLLYRSLGPNRRRHIQMRIVVLVLLHRRLSSALLRRLFVIMSRIVLLICVMWS